jgi:YegS/Rv2252/BmrU family lipid kinase
VSERPTIGVIVNEGKQLGEGLEMLRAILAEHGHADPPWAEVPKSKKAPKQIRRLVRDEGVDRLLVWGGDGTVRRAIDTILGDLPGDEADDQRDDGLGDVEVGILPAGTGNLLATNLGIPIELRDAAEIAITGEARPIDVGVMNGNHFAVMGGTGFDAMLIAEADDTDLKDRFGRLGYVWAGIRHTTLPPAHAEVRIDDEPWFAGDASCVIAANVSTILGGVTVFPDASMTDGRLDVGVVRARSRTDWLRLLGRAVTRRPEDSPLAEMTTASRVSITLDRSLPWEVDGGDRDRTDVYEIACRPAAIRICRPSAEQ